MVYIYRLVASRTMEEKVFQRQLLKRAQNLRAIDRKTVNAGVREEDLDLYEFDETIESSDDDEESEQEDPSEDDGIEPTPMRPSEHEIKKRVIQRRAKEVGQSSASVEAERTRLLGVDSPAIPWAATCSRATRCVIIHLPLAP